MAPPALGGGVYTVVDDADGVVTMGCGDAGHVHPGRRYVDWELEDSIPSKRFAMNSQSES